MKTIKVPVVITLHVQADASVSAAPAVVEVAAAPRAVGVVKAPKAVKAAKALRSPTGRQVCRLQQQLTPAQLARALTFTGNLGDLARELNVDRSALSNYRVKAGVRMQARGPVRAISAETRAAVLAAKGTDTQIARQFGLSEAFVSQVRAGTPAKPKRVRKYRRIPDALRVEAAQSKLTAAEIAKKLQIHPDTVNDLRREARAKADSHGHTPSGNGVVGVR